MKVKCDESDPLSVRAGDDGCYLKIGMKNQLILDRLDQLTSYGEATVLEALETVRTMLDRLLRQ